MSDDHYTDDVDSSRKTVKGAINPNTGLPRIKEHNMDRMELRFLWVRVWVPLVVALLSTGFGYSIHHFGDTETYESRIATIKLYDFQWASAGILVLIFTVIWMNIFPMMHKARIQRDGNLRANMFIFRLATENPEESSAIIMHEKGDIGRYNRANRSIHSFLDWVTATMSVLPFTFFVYPLPSFICLAVFFVGHLIY